MAAQKDPKLDGAAFDDYFESLGKKAEHLSVNDSTATAPVATNSTTPVIEVKPEAEDDQKVVDEIESLCMNCRENVTFPQSSFQPIAHQTVGYHPFTAHSNPFLPRDHNHVILLSALQLQKL